MFVWSCDGSDMEPLSDQDILFAVGGARIRAT